LWTVDLRNESAAAPGPQPAGDALGNPAEFRSPAVCPCFHRDSTVAAPQYHAPWLRVAYGL